MSPKLFITILSLVFSLSAHAALSLNNTRYIFIEGQRSIPVEIENEADVTYAAQLWVDNYEEGTLQSNFFASPAFFKVKAKDKEYARIMNIGQNLPSDKETLFWLKLQEIPPKVKDAKIYLALQIQVKMIYRPKTLVAGRKGAESQLKIVNHPGSQWLVNDTPYIFSISSLQDKNTQAIAVSEETKQKLRVFLPGSKVNVTGMNVVGVNAVNDHGNNTYYPIS